MTQDSKEAIRKVLSDITCRFCKAGFELLPTGKHVSYSCGTDGIARFRHEDTACTSKADEIITALPALTEPSREEGPRPLGRRFVVQGSDIVKLANGEVLPVEEPLFLMRARDWLAIPMLEKYRELAVADGCNDYILELFDQSLKDFKEFKAKYPERMKQPGITRGK